MTTNNEHKSLSFFLGSLALACLWDWMFYDKISGISFPLFILALYGVFYALFQDQLRFAWRFEWVMTLPILLLSLTFALFSNSLLLMLNSLAVLLLFVAQTFLLTKNNRVPWDQPTFLIHLLEKVIIHTPSKIPVPFRMIKKWTLSGPENRIPQIKAVLKILFGILLALPLLFIVTLLLSSADSIFREWIHEIIRWVGDVDLGEWPLHFLIITFFFFLFFCYFWSLHEPSKEEEEEQAQTVEKAKLFRMDGLIAITILLLFNVVYAIFVFIQVSYLFGNAESLLPEGVTYADYAKQGFSQINVVTVINLVMLLVFLQLVNKEQRKMYRLVQYLLSFLTFCTGVMLYSAFFRLYMYEQAYGFTLLRFLPHAFMILLLILITIAFMRIWFERVSLFRTYMIAILVWYVVLNYINMDRIIAEINIQRYHQTRQIDLAYLASLSYDSVPALVKLRRDPFGDKEVEKQVKQILKNKYQLYKSEKDWQSFSYSRYRAGQLLEP